MTEDVSLALAVKFRALFASDDRFLTFPLGLGYSYPALAFMAEGGGLSPQERLHYQADFARYMNQIPMDGPPAFTPAAGMLWDVFRGTLTEAQYATSTLTAEEKAQLAAAVALLDGPVLEDGGRTATRYLVYRRYRDLYYSTEKTYLDARQTADATGREQDRQRADELQSALAAAQQDWLELGSKLEVEEALGTRQALEAKRSPILFQQALLRDLKRAETPALDAPGSDFCLTLYSPRDAFAGAAQWLEANLVGGEIAALVAAAPPELRTLFPAQDGAAGIVQLSVEYSYIDIVRPWFRPEFFSTRCWSLPGTEPVCDGGRPVRGRLGAYVTGFLAVRKVTVSRSRERAGTSFQLPIVVPGSLAPGGAVPAPPRPPTGLKVAAATGLMARPAAAATVLEVAAARAFRPVAGSRGSAALAARAELNAMRYLAAVSPGTTFLRTGLTLPAAAAPALEEPDRTTTESYALDGITVLALVCRRLPRCPDPDPTLDW